MTLVYCRYSLLIWLLISHVFYLICYLESTSSNLLFQENLPRLLSRDMASSDLRPMSPVSHCLFQGPRADRTD